jgi:ABC-type multidrug transport system fused ATPase/permease subunit
MGFLVSGTLRSNLDPFGLYDDSRLWDALKRAYLVDTNETQPPSPITVTESEQTTSRFDLDTAIDGEGSNLSVGQVEFFLSFFLYARH